MASYPYPPAAVPSTSTLAFHQPKPSTSSFDPRLRDLARTPSPTPSEVDQLSRKGFVNWEAMRHRDFWLRKDRIGQYVVWAVILTLAILLSVFNDQIVRALQPATNWMHNTKGGWLIPIAILFVISFPPLFGHEIVAILCGIAWGLGPGFAIVFAGSFLGEIANFYTFKYWCHTRGLKYEAKNLQYGCLAKVIRDGGFKVALIARLSSIPSHFTTAIFSTCGMSIWTFCLASVLSSPMQVINVYIGVVLKEKEEGSESNLDKTLSNVILGVTIAITTFAYIYIQRRMIAVKGDVIYARRKARQGKVARASFSSASTASSADLLNHDAQPWDEERAIGGGIHAPVPQHAPGIVVSNTENQSSDRGDANLSGMTTPRHYTDFSISDSRRDGPTDTAGWDSLPIQGGSRPIVGAGPAVTPSPPPSYRIPGR